MGAMGVYAGVLSYSRMNIRENHSLQSPGIPGSIAVAHDDSLAAAAQKDLSID